MDLLDQKQPQIPVPAATSEKAYDRLTRSRFAEQYVEGKTVAFISCGEVGYGVHVLARASDSVVGLTSDAQALELARTYYPAPNVTYREADLPEMPYPDNHFDVVVAFEALEYFERPDDLAKAAKRVLKPEGVFVASTPDKQAHSNDRNHRDKAHKKEMYVPEFREMLERNFEGVSIYRQGTVVGGMIFDPAGSFSNASVESDTFFSPDPSSSAEPPETLSVVAVCSSSESSIQQNGLPYLLLDRDRHVYDECEDQREDIRLLQDEIRQMEETEVQAFRDAIRMRATEIGHLKAQLQEIGFLKAQLKKSKAESKEAREHYEARIEDLRRVIDTYESSRTWQMLSAYRLARTKLRALIQSRRKGR